MIRVETMKSCVLAEAIRAETMGLPYFRKNPISRGFREIVDLFPRMSGTLTSKRTYRARRDGVFACERVADHAEVGVLCRAVTRGSW